LVVLTSVLFVAGCASVDSPRRPVATAPVPAVEKTPYPDLMEALSPIIAMLKSGTSPSQTVLECEKAFDAIDSFESRHIGDSDAAKMAASLRTLFGRIYERAKVARDGLYLHKAMMDRNAGVLERVEAADRLRALLSDALGKKGIWSASNTDKLKSLLREAERVYYFGTLSMSLREAERLYESTNDPKTAIKACEKACEAIDAVEKREGLLSIGERKRLREIWSEFHFRKIKTKKEFEALIREAEALLSRERRSFSDTRAAHDIRSAKNTLGRNQAKWFNWGWLGHPRDSTDSLYRAKRLCDRTLRSKWVSRALKNQAARVCNDIVARFSPSEQAACSNYPKPKDYSAWADFPNWNPEKKAKKLWARLRQCERKTNDGKKHRYEEKKGIIIRGNPRAMRSQGLHVTRKAL